MSDIFISIDTEFSAGGLFSGTGTPVTSQAVYCNIVDRSHGLGFMLDTFRDTNVKATFFVEAAHTAYLGFDPMRPAVEDITAAGHDIQLHLHPLWLHTAGRFPRAPVNDSAAAMDSPALRQLFETGLEAFRRWGLPHPVAFRAGNLEMGRQVYDIMSEFDIPISSSVGTAIHRSDDPALWLDHGSHTIGSVTELPVLGYTDLAVGSREHKKNLTITGCGIAETRAILKQAASSGHEDIVLLTHPFEFVKRHNTAFTDLSVNRANQKRLRKLCQLIDESPILTARTFADKAPDWAANADLTDLPSLKAPLPSVLARIAENKLNDLLRWY